MRSGVKLGCGTFAGPMPHSWSVYVCNSFKPAPVISGVYFEVFSLYIAVLSDVPSTAVAANPPRPFMLFFFASADEHSITPTAKGNGWLGTRTAISWPIANCGSPSGGTITPARNRSAPPSTYWQHEI